MKKYKIQNQSKKNSHACVPLRTLGVCLRDLYLFGGSRDGFESINTVYF